jgi:Lrp/AsnC family transcriptional regulator, regulator for asnA, asnC and gidA
VDELDQEIIRFLRQDGRTPYTRIAEELGVTEGTVRNRVARLQEEKVIQIIGMTDPHRMGFEAPAMIGVTVQPPHLEAAAVTIATMPEVSYLILVSGEYDLMVEVLCRDREHLATFLREQLHTVAGIQRTQTFMILETYKMALGAQPRTKAAGASVKIER